MQKWRRHVRKLAIKSEFEARCVAKDMPSGRMMWKRIYRKLLIYKP